VLVVGLGIWAFSALNSTFYYNEVVAQVERVEAVCRPVGTQVSSAASCQETQAKPGGKGMFRETAVYVRYRFPADGKEHSGVVIPSGGRKAVEALHLRPGERWQILVHKSNPGDIKAE